MATTSNAARSWFGAAFQSSRRGTRSITSYGDFVADEEGLARPFGIPLPPAGRIEVQDLERYRPDGTISRRVLEGVVAVQRSTVDGHIVRNSGVLGGESIVRGTRISVRNIVLASREYEAPEGILKAYPQLTIADVHGALAYYRAHKSEIDRYIQANVDDD